MKYYLFIRKKDLIALIDTKIVLFLVYMKWND